MKEQNIFWDLVLPNVVKVDVYDRNGCVLTRLEITPTAKDKLSEINLKVELWASDNNYDFTADKLWAAVVLKD